MNRQKGNVSTYGLIPLIAVVAGFAVAAAASMFMLQSGVNSNHRSMLGNSLATEIAQQVNIKDAQISELLRTLALTDIVTDSVTGSQTDRITAEARIQTFIPRAAKVSIIPLGAAKIDQGYPPFNFTALDLVNRSEIGENPTMEAISTAPQLEGEKWIINATPIAKATGEIIGTLFVYLDPSAISDQLTSGASGEASIMQFVGTTPKPVVRVGSGSRDQYSAELNNPNWTIQFSPARSLASSSPTSIFLYLIPPLLMLLLAAAGVVVGAGRIGSAINANLAKLAEQLGRATTGKYDEGEYTLPGFLNVDLQIKPLVALTNTAKPKTAQPAKKKAKVKPATSAEPDSEIVEIEMDDDVEDLDMDVDEFEDLVEDIEEDTEEEDLLGDLLEEEEDAAPAHPAIAISEEIFRAYDIRGIVGETLSEEIANKIGLAIGSEAQSLGQESILVGYDGREYSPALAEALIEGITATGTSVINLGSVPTPLVYYATHNSETQSGVVVTGSHNPPDYNGFKIVLDGRTLIDEDIQGLHQRILNNDFVSGEGDISMRDITQDYIDAIADDVVVAQPLKVVVDCGNGIAGSITPELLDALGCEPIPLYCEVDGTFPNHHPDPTKAENLEDLILTVKSQEADFGIALDGDGDRLVAVTAEGEIVWPDKLLMLFAKDVVSRNPGSDVVYDIKCTRHLNSVVSGFGGRPIISRSGHSYVKAKIKETGAMLGGEFSGHICFSERWFGFDDAMYSAARLLEIVGAQEESLSDLLKEFPDSVATPEIHIAVDDKSKFDIIEQMVEAADFEDSTVTTVDGLRIDFADGWGLIRASNTEPALTLRFEADTKDGLEDIKEGFRELLEEVNKNLTF